MVLKNVFVLPHGSMILNPLKTNIPESAKELNAKMNEISRAIASIDPDLCILITPHGIALSHDYGLYMNRTASGSAEWEGEWNEFEVKIDIDLDKTTELFNVFKKDNLPVSTITCYSSNVNAPLRWGEVVPLWFLRNISSKFIILSLPTRRYNQVKMMTSELERLGMNLASFVERLPEKTIILISADLAHTHDPKGPYGFSEKAEIFDTIIEEWLTSGLKKELLIDQAADILDEALACGYAGFVVLQGIIENHNIETRVLTRSHPSYYGMTVAEITFF
ncbi:MAG: hypothetical protein ACTSW1_02820 [Candidatus Hodarchaeales archaeon]